MIGIFDSGIGGLTTVRAIMNLLPQHDILYFGDTARTPYGSKSYDTVVRYALENTEFLLNRGATTIVIACNTASSLATEAIREEFNVPVFEVITPAVTRAMETFPDTRIGVIGTRATIRSGIYEKKIKDKNPTAKVYSAACPLLVPLVEEGWFKRPETTMIVKKYLHPLKVRQIETLILGCTHYPLLKKIIQRKIGQRVNIIDSSEAVAQSIKTFFDGQAAAEHSEHRQGNAQFFVSDITEQFAKTANLILKRKISLKHVAL